MTETRVWNLYSKIMFRELQDRSSYWKERDGERMSTLLKFVK